MQYFSSDYRRASIATIITELFNFFSNYTLVDEKKSIYRNSIYMFSIILHYTLDIFIAKSFENNQNKFKWYLNSFVKNNFSKYLVYSILHFLVSQNIMNYIKATLDNYDIKHKYRDITLNLLLNMFLFALYGYFLKFKWAYADSSDPMMTMIVLNWCTLSIMIYIMSQKVE